MKNLLLSIETSMAEHDPGEDDQSVDNSVFGFPDIKVPLVRQPFGSNGVKVALFVVYSSNAVDVDKAFV